MKLIKAMATVAGMTGLSRIAGFARDILTAAILGAGPMADAFFVALKLPNLFRRITAEGAFSVSFVPLYAKTLETGGEREAQDFASNAFMVMLCLLSVFTILAVWAMPYILYVIAPGFADDPERYSMALDYARITFPYLLLMSLTALIGGVMNAHNRFAPFAFVPTLFNLCLIAALLLSKYFPSPGLAMSWGLLVSGFVQLAFMAACMRRAGLRITFAAPRLDAPVKKVFRLMGPGLIGAGVVQINLFADIIIASFLGEGSISYLYYADRLNQLPLGVVGIAVGTALLPMLSRAMTRDDKSEAVDLFNRALEYCLILALPAAVALAVIPHELVTVLFERGAFGEGDSMLTARVLMAYAVGLPAYIAIKVFSTAHWARHDTKTPVKIAIIGVALNIAVALSLIWSMGVAGIALATGLTGWVQYYLHVRALRDHESVRFDARFKRNVPRIIAASCVMGAGLFILGLLLEGWIYGSAALWRMAGLAVLVAGGGAVYGAAIFGLGAVKPGDLKTYFLQNKKRKKR